MNTPACAMNEVSALVNTDALPVNDDITRCRVCGCTEEHGCPGGCCWVEDPEGGELCSACAAHDDEGWPISSLMEDFTNARKELARAQASDGRVGEVLAAGRVMAVLLEGVVQDCAGCDGTGRTLVSDKQIDCPDCAQVRQTIHDWAKANGRYHANRESEKSTAVRLIRGIACHPASALAAEKAAALEELGVVAVDEEGEG